MRLIDFLKLSLIVCIGSSLLSCSGARLALTRKQREQLVLINMAIGNFESAVVSAFDGSSKTGDPDIERMARQLVLAQCQQRLQKPRKDFASSWTASEIVQSERCPIYLSRQWAFDAATRSWTVHQEMVARQTAFANLSGIKSMGLEGSLVVSHPEPSGTLIQGAISYKQFELVGLGQIQAKIDTNQVYKNDTGRGSLELTLVIERQTLVAKMEWDLDKTGAPQIRHLLNGENIDAADFSEAFSSFGLDEIMAKSLQMRYL